MATTTTGLGTMPGDDLPGFAPPFETGSWLVWDSTLPSRSLDTLSPYAGHAQKPALKQIDTSSTPSRKTVARRASDRTWRRPRLRRSFPPVPPGGPPGRSGAAADRPNESRRRRIRASKSPLRSRRRSATGSREKEPEAVREKGCLASSADSSSCENLPGRHPWASAHCTSQRSWFFYRTRPHHPEPNCKLSAEKVTKSP